MATAVDVLTMLRPDGGWFIQGSEYEGITWLEAEPLTEAEFKAGFAQYDAWKAKQEADAQAAKEATQAKLEALGLSVDDLKVLGLV